MLVQNIYLSKYDWDVKIYYAVDRYYTDDILKDLDDLGIDIIEQFKIKDILENQKVNTGFTYSDYRTKQSIIVIGLTTSASEFQNTFDHEKGHLAMHISRYYHLDPYGEECQYLSGEIGKQMFPYAKMFLCDSCRQNFTLYN